MKTFLVFLFFSFTWVGCATVPTVKLEGGCQPCLIDISSKNKFFFYYEINETDEEFTVNKIRVTTPQDKPIQRLDIKEMVPVLDLNELFMGSLDINFDGKNDIYLITSRGSSNVYANYWIFDKNSEKFLSAGVFPIFTVHDGSKTLSTLENIGSGGREYIKRIYRPKDKNIELLYEEKQLRDLKTGKFKILKKGTLPN